MPSSGENTDTISAEYTVVRLNRDNCKDLAALYAAVQGKTIDPSYFENKYNTGYTGHAYTGLLAYNKEGVPVAFNGLQPCFITFNGIQVLAAQNTDIMTHPGYRYRGMFTELSQQLFSMCRELGIRLLFGFPNQNSYHGAVNKLGWKITEHLSRFSVPVQPFLPVVLLKKIKLLRPLYRSYRSRVLRKIKINEKGFASSVIKEGFAGVQRNEAYLENKTCSETFVLEAGDARVWLSDKYHLMIGDMENITADNFLLIMNAVEKTARRLGLKEIQFHASPATSLHKLCETLYPKHESYPVLFQDFGSAIDPGVIKFNFADIDIF